MTKSQYTLLIKLLWGDLRRKCEVEVSSILNNFSPNDAMLWKFHSYFYLYSFSLYSFQKHYLRLYILTYYTYAVSMSIMLIMQMENVKMHYKNLWSCCECIFFLWFTLLALAVHHFSHFHLTSLLHYSALQ